MHKLTLLDGQTADTTTTWVKPPAGVYTIFFRGDLDGATLTLRFSDDGMSANPDSADFTFTANPAPFQFRFPDGFHMSAGLSGSGAATDVTFGVKRDGGK